MNILRGNPGHRPAPANEPTPDAYHGACPSWLDERAREFWEMYAPPLSHLGLLTELDVPALAAACERWSLYRRATEALAIELTQDTGANGRVARPEAAIAKAALEGARSILAEFGFSPAARARLGASGARTGDDLDAFTRQRRARA